MDELPEEAIQEAEVVTELHSHDSVTWVDGSLVEHLQVAHRLDAVSELSASTQQGLHDRLHDQTDAVDD